MTTTRELSDEERLDNATNSLRGVGWHVESRDPGRVVLARPKIQYPLGLFLLLTVITLGAFLLIWVPLTWCVPRYVRMTLTIVDGQLVQARKWSYS